MAWEERFNIGASDDFRNSLLIGRNDDWVIPLRTCYDFDGNVDTFMHQQLQFQTSNSPSVTYNNKVYIFHGFVPRDKDQASELGGYASRALVYDLTSSSGDLIDPQNDYRLQHIRPVPYVAYDSVACVHLSDIHIFGGQSLMGGVLFNYHYKYNPITDTYTQLANMPAAREGHSAISVGNYIYVMGGGHTSTWRYDVASDSWSIMANMPRSRDSFDVAEYNNKIYLFGGNVGSTFLSVIDVYDINSNSWSTLASSKDMPTARRHLRVERMGRRAIAFGGLITAYESTGITEVFNFATETWDTSLDDAPSLPSRHCSGVYNGMLYSVLGWISLSSVFAAWSGTIERIDLSVLINSPSVPTNFGGVGTDVDTILLGWDIEPDAVYYEIQYGLTPSGTLTTLENVKGDTYRLSGLSDDTEYRVRIRACNSLGCSVYTSYVNITTPAIPSVPSAPTGDSPPRIDGGLNVTWTASANSTSYDLRYIENATELFKNAISETSTTLTSLKYGTTYSLSVRGVNFYDVSDWSSSNPLTTAPKTPTISLNSSTTTSITVNFNVDEGNWSYVSLWYRVSGSGSGFNRLDVNNPSTSETITGLTSGVEYEIKASSFYVVNSIAIESIPAFSASIFVTTGLARPTDWAWSYTIVSGGNVYNVINKNIYIMPATEWNGFTTRINDFRAYKGFSSYTFTNVSSNQDVTKDIINEALNAIRDMSVHFTGGNTLISNRVTGQNILDANIYINMRDCLNSIT